MSPLDVDPRLLKRPKGITDVLEHDSFYHFYWRANRRHCHNHQAKARCGYPETFLSDGTNTPLRYDHVLY